MPVLCVCRCATTASVKKTSAALHPASSPRTDKVRKTRLILMKVQWKSNGKNHILRHWRSQKGHICLSRNHVARQTTYFTVGSFHHLFSLFISFFFSKNRSQWITSSKSNCCLFCTQGFTWSLPQSTRGSPCLPKSSLNRSALFSWTDR